MTQAYPNHARRRLAAGKLAIGMVLRQARTVDIAGIARSCGFDWLSVDMEHGAFGIETAAQIAAAALPSGITPLVRVSGADPSRFVPILEAGAQGVIVPHVENEAAARAAVAQYKSPFRSRNQEMLLALMLESRQGLDNALTIARVPGVDVMLIGINDLCESLGVPGEFGHASVEAAFRTLTAACQSAGIHAGMSGVHEPELVKKYVGMGLAFIGGGTDQSLLIAAGRQRASFLRSLER